MNLNNFFARLSNIIRQDFIKIMSFSSISYLLKTISQFIISKVLAINVGPAGLAILGQLSNVINIFQSIASAGVSLGVTKYVAEFENDSMLQRRVVNNAFKLVLFFSLVTTVVIFFSYKLIGRFLFNSEQFDLVLLASAVSIIFFSFNTIILSVLNGFKLFKIYVKISMLSSLTNLIITVLFVLAWGLTGALYAMAVMPIFLFFIALIYVKKFDWLGFKFVSYKFDSTIVKKLSSFSLMAVNNTIVGSVAQIFIRFMIIKKITVEEAGFWDSMLKISSAYMLLITTSIQIYFLPTLSAIKEPHLLWKMISKVNKIIIPTVIFCLAILYLFRQQVVLVLFSKEFLPITDFFMLQIIGDIIKIASWSFAYLMYAKAMTKELIVSDNIFTLTYLIGVYFSVDYLHLEGVYVSNIINNLVYLVFIYFFIKKHLSKNQYLNV